MLKKLFVGSLISLSTFVVSVFAQKVETGPNSPTMVRVKAEVWADNWFSFFLGEKLIKEDSVPITTERSFNAEIFTFEAVYPLTFNFVAKDYIQNDTGLEYVGTNRQQIGDGGLIAQFTNADTGERLAVTNADWRCLVIHDAPLDEKCARESDPISGKGPCQFTKLEEPKIWKSPQYDDSKWPKAIMYEANEVGPKGGWAEISWDASAHFIWGPDLKRNNTVLCRLKVAAPKK